MENQVTKKEIEEINKMLFKVVQAQERIEAALVGTSFTNNEGLVHKVADHEVRINNVEEWKLKNETLNADLEKRVTKHHSITAAIAAAIGAIATAIGLFFSTKH